LHLLAKICAKSNRKQRAIQYYKMSLELDPLLWKSFEELCNLGVQDVDPTSVFGVSLIEEKQTTMPMPMSMPTQQTTNTNSTNVLTPALTPYQIRPDIGGILQPSTTMATPASSSLQRASLFGTATHTGNGGGGGGLFGTPNLTPIPTEQSFAILAPQTTTNRAVQRARKVAFRDYYEPSPEARSASHNKPRSLFWGGISPSDNNNTHSKTLLFASETKSSNKNDTSILKQHHHHHQPVMDQSAAPSTTPRPHRDDAQTTGSEEDGGVHTVLELLCLLGMAQLNLGQFRSKKAIQLYQRLPDEHYHTGWVLHQVGRAYFAMADYQNAIRSLQVMEQVEPHRMAGLEVLSTALWQTKREVELSHLAQRVTDFDRLSAEVWCVVGNCFSLQKEHETALTFFRRSIQLDPSFTYSHTLSGHEYFASEDFDRAVACYRDAIRADERHYNAWYGLGAVYYRQEKFDLAEYHFRRACSINPQSSVLICHLGMAQNANGKPYEALDTLQTAFRLDPHNPQAHYQRALVYQSLDRNEEALVELERVRDAAPREAQIHFSMGRLYKRMGRTERAMRCFLDALDLDPKDTNLIKVAMEKMDEPDVEEEISAF
jgi:anaphase-promoting complex subunit 3